MTWRRPGADKPRPTWKPVWKTAGIGVMAGAALHYAPGAVGWRRGRVLLPRLAGVGAHDHVALSFDDGPDQRSTPAILDVLDRLGWKATFFCLGTQARRWPALTRELVERGHEIGVHGDRHVSHRRRPATWTVPDLLRARDTAPPESEAACSWSYTSAHVSP